MKRLLFAVLALHAAGAMAWAQRPDAGNQPPIPALIVTGNADIRVAPDEAVIRVGIVRQAPNAQTAQQQVSAAAQDILAAVTGAGIPAKNIQTSRLTLTPV